MSDGEEEVEMIEVDLLLEGIFRRYGYDFRNYARMSVRRRLAQFLTDSGCASYAEVTGRMLRDASFFHRLISYFSVSVTALFRDPFFYEALREGVVPLLRTWPRFKIWHAGCATGEEVYSFAVLLREEGIVDRAMIYATDINQAALETAKAGVYALDIVQKGSRNYQLAAGHGSLTEHYRVRYNAAIMDAALRNRITFARHNLAMDNSFGEMQVVICRNVLIYFNRELQERVLRMFWESLDYGGFLCLGDKESLVLSSLEERFESVDEKARIYKKRV